MVFGLRKNWSTHNLANRLRQHTVVFSVAIFLFAFAVRILAWQDNHQNVLKVQESVTARYKESAKQLVAGDFKAFVTDVQRLGHPPGYPILLAVIFKLAGESATTIQIIQMVVDCVAVVVVFMIALELFQFAVAITTALLAALSPQFSYFSVLLLPDSVVVLPILLAVYFIIRSRSHYSISSLLMAGALVGLSC